MSTLTYAMPRAEARPTSLRAAFAVLVLAMLPAVLDQTVLATALPTIAGELGSIDDVSHLVTVYVLASTATTPLWGKLGDRHGRRALLGARAVPVPARLRRLRPRADASSNSWSRAASRAIAAGGLMSLAMASVGDLVTPRERARWQGRIATVFAGAAVAGPLIGGLLVEHASWRWVFYVNLPVGLAALVGMWRFLPAGTREEHPRPLDLVGAGLLAVASASALLALQLGRRDARLDLARAARPRRARRGERRRLRGPRAARRRPRGPAGDARHADRARGGAPACSSSPPRCSRSSCSCRCCCRSRPASRRPRPGCCSRR